MAQVQMQFRPVALEFITADSLTNLGIKVTAALADGKMLHGDWHNVTSGYAQAVCKADWRPMPPPPQQESSILQPQPQRILG